MCIPLENCAYFGDGDIVTLNHDIIKQDYMSDTDNKMSYPKISWSIEATRSS